MSFFNTFIVNNQIPESKVFKVLGRAADIATKDFYDNNPRMGLKGANVDLDFGPGGLKLKFSADIRYDLLLCYEFHKTMLEKFGPDCFSEVDVAYMDRLRIFLPHLDCPTLRKFDRLGVVVDKKTGALMKIRKDGRNITCWNLR